MKEYVKLTGGQFRELIEFITVLLAMLRDMNEHLARTPAAKFDSIMVGEFGHYSHVYEQSFIHHLSTVVVVVLNRIDEVKAWAMSSDPQEAVLELIRRRGEVDDDKPIHEAFDDGDLVTLAYSLGRTIQSVATYGRSISSLLQDVRETNNHDSLFKAIRMDLAVIGCPTAMNQIARAQ